jgi:tRNA U38,U39,U40 pseudouridine synthase TruA
MKEKLLGLHNFHSFIEQKKRGGRTRGMSDSNKIY